MRKIPSRWSEEHRLALSVIAGASAVMLTFGFLSIGEAIKRPFEPKGPPTKTLDQREKEAEQALKLRDTDGDGLTDYDEINLYRTSAYIADTDSDGVADGAEVRAGEDPNCPRGKNCGSQAANAAPPAKVDTSYLFPNANQPNPLEAFNLGGPLDASLLASFDAPRIRALMKAAGVPQETLDKLTDSQLEAIYKEVLSEQVPTSTANLILKEQ